MNLRNLNVPQTFLSILLRSWFQFERWLELNKTKRNILPSEKFNIASFLFQSQNSILENDFPASILIKRFPFIIKWELQKCFRWANNGRNEGCTNLRVGWRWCRCVGMALKENALLYHKEEQNNHFYVNCIRTGRWLIVCWTELNWIEKSF